jgi:hypothetical protein
MIEEKPVKVREITEADLGPIDEKPAKVREITEADLVPRVMPKLTEQEMRWWSAHAKVRRVMERMTDEALVSMTERDYRVLLRERFGGESQQRITRDLIAEVRADILGKRCLVDRATPMNAGNKEPDITQEEGCALTQQAAEPEATQLDDLEILDLTGSVPERIKKHAPRWVLHTSGEGLWSNAARTVRITGSEQLGTRLVLDFDPADWNTAKLDLIYTDPLFITELREHLAAIGIHATTEYSEQGAQGDTWVDFDFSIESKEEEYPDASGAT